MEINFSNKAKESYRKFQENKAKADLIHGGPLKRIVITVLWGMLSATTFVVFGYSITHMVFSEAEDVQPAEKAVSDSSANISKNGTTFDALLEVFDEFE